MMLRLPYVDIGLRQVLPNLLNYDQIDLLYSSETKKSLTYIRSSEIAPFELTTERIYDLGFLTSERLFVENDPVKFHLFEVNENSILADLTNKKVIWRFDSRGLLSTETTINDDGVESIHVFKVDDQGDLIGIDDFIFDKQSGITCDITNHKTGEPLFDRMAFHSAKRRLELQYGRINNQIYLDENDRVIRKQNDYIDTRWEYDDEGNWQSYTKSGSGTAFLESSFTITKNEDKIESLKVKYNRKGQVIHQLKEVKINSLRI